MIPHHKHVTKRAAKPIAGITRPRAAMGPGPEHADIGVLPGTDLLPAVQNVVTSAVQEPAAPVAMAVALLLFLLMQHRIDRRDPKLASSRNKEPVDLPFGAVIRTA